MYYHLREEQGGRGRNNEEEAVFFRNQNAHLIPKVPLGYFFTPSADTTSLGLTRNTSPRFQPSPGPSHFPLEPPPPLDCGEIPELPLPPDEAFAGTAADDLLS